MLQRELFLNPAFAMSTGARLGDQLAPRSQKEREQFFERGTHLSINPPSTLLTNNMGLDYAGSLPVQFHYVGARTIALSRITRASR